MDWTYKEVRFKDLLDARYAKFFDNHSIKWVYVDEKFYLPEIAVILEVTQDSGSEAKSYYDDWWVPSVLSIVGRANGSLYMAGGTKSEVAFSKCTECGKHFFLEIVGGFQCRACGKQDGDHYLAIWEELLKLPFVFKGE